MPDLPSLDYCPPHPEWRHIEEEDICYPGGESDSADEFLWTPSGSPLWDMPSLHPDFIGNVPIEYSAPSHDGHLYFFDNPRNMRDDIAATGSRFCPERTSGPDEMSLAGRDAATSRQSWNQQNHPYYRPAQEPLSSYPSAPHSDYPYLDNGSFHGASDGVAYRHHDHPLPVQTPSPPAPVQIPLPPSAFYSARSLPDVGDYIRRGLCLPMGVPVNLWSVCEPTDGTKPPLSMGTLAALAIYGSECKKLTLQGICRALIARFKWYNEHQGDDSWKNSMRHCLSYRNMFVKAPRPADDPGKGYYWVIDLSSPDAFSRPRKRKSVKSSPRRSGNNKKKQLPERLSGPPRMTPTWTAASSSTGEHMPPNTTHYRTSGSGSDEPYVPNFDTFHLALHNMLLQPPPSSLPSPGTSARARKIKTNRGPRTSA